MNLIEKIIEELVDSNKSLTDPLLKTKVLASRIGNSELFHWVDNELAGYKLKHEELPSYRLGNPTFLCTMQQGWNTEENVPLPVMIFDKEFIEPLLKFKFDDSVKTLEEQADGEHGDTIYKEFPPDLCTFLTSKIINNHQLQIRIVKLRLLIHISQMTQVLSVIRSKLLDFMLRIESEFPNLDELLKEKIKMKNDLQDKVDKIVHQTIINAGDGNTITTGNKNTVKAKYKIVKGDIDAFKEELKRNKVSEEDIEEIATIVQEEQPDKLTGNFGPRTSGWLSKMYQKSIDGTWQVGIATAGGLLVELLKLYFGG